MRSLCCVLVLVLPLCAQRREWRFEGQWFKLTGSSDTTKRIRFQLDGLTTATEREITFPDADFTVVGTSLQQTLSLKTLSAPILQLPVINAYTVATLPAAATANRVAIVTDAASAGSCTSGGGSARAWCRDTGSAWEPLGDGGGGGGLADPGANGFLDRTALNVTAARTLTGTSNEIDISNGGGGGNPTFSLSPTFDISGKTSTKSVKTGTAPPGSCATGELFYDTDAAAGLNLFGCTAPNTWTLLGDGTGGSSAFNAITSGTNTTATMTVDTGASIVATGTGSVMATQVFSAAGAAPSTNAAIAYDSTVHAFEVGVNGVNKTLALVDGNVATATALAADVGSGSPAKSGGGARHGGGAKIGDE